MIDISIIIINWNVKDFLRKCLGSIYKSSQGVRFEVLVVDNASLDGSMDMVRREYPGVVIIENKSNLGFARANNIALKRACGRYILFLNPDTEIFSDTLLLMVKVMDENISWSGIAPKLIFSDGVIQKSCRHFPSLFTDLMENLYLDWIFPGNSFFNYYRMGAFKYDKITMVDVPYGASLLIRRSVLDAVGPMDERFFMYYDEIDLCYRIKRYGGSVYYVPDIKVVHHCNKSSDQVLSEAAAWKRQSKSRFFLKHYGHASLYILSFNLLLRAFLIWTVMAISHKLFSHPRDLASLKEDVRLLWREYMSAIYGRGVYGN